MVSGQKQFPDHVLLFTIFYFSEAWDEGAPRCLALSCHGRVPPGNCCPVQTFLLPAHYGISAPLTNIPGEN